MTLPLYASIAVHRFKGGELKKEAMEVATEYPVALCVNGSVMATIAVSAADLEYLALGHLISEGIIRSHAEVDSIVFDEKKLILDVKLKNINRQQAVQSPRIVTGGGRAKTIDAPDEFIRKKLPVVGAEIIKMAAGEFLQPSELRKRTSGFHAAALYTLKGEELAFFDEIGRHSAIDKVIGYACKEGISLTDKIILSTGRVSSEIAGKIIYSGVPVFISRATPTHYATELLKTYNVIFICRANNEGFVVVGGHENINIRTSS